MINEKKLHKHITLVYYMAELTFSQNLVIQLYWEDEK